MRVISRMEVRGWDRHDERNATTGERIIKTVRGLLGGECTGKNGGGCSRPQKCDEEGQEEVGNDNGGEEK